MINKIFLEKISENTDKFVGILNINGMLINCKYRRIFSLMFELHSL